MIARRIFRGFWLFAVAIFAAGCSVVNFSGNYYDLPQNYRQEIQWTWKKLIKELPLKKSYRYVILTDQQFEKAKGIPAISETTVILPENFIKYVYQNYYDFRTVIFASVITHELCHVEFNLPSTPPKEHFKVDQVAIKLLGKGQVTTTFYYQSLYVMRNYWFARKGMAGHAFNVGWNVANAAALVATGHGRFGDWFATDLDERMGLIRQNYKLLTTDCFARSGGTR